MKRAMVFLAVALIACTASTTPAPSADNKSSLPARTGLSKITRVVIDKVESPTFEGRTFGSIGQYEKLVGRAFGVTDPKDPIDAGIVNLDKAPRNAQGLVEYDVDFYILKPIALDKGNKTLFYDVVNRGNKNLHTTFNVGAGGANDPTKSTDAGDGLLMQQGYTLVWSGWQGDVPAGANRLTTRFPVATNNGTPITKKIRTEFVFDSPGMFSVPVSWDRGPGVTAYPAVESAMSSATLSRRSGQEGEPQPIARSEWSFDKCEDGKAKTASNVDVCYPAGFSTNYVYDLVYEARDPIVMGLGFAATRDIMSFLRYDTTDGNPLVAKGSGANPIRLALGFGSSQSGRFLKDLIYQGFNQDSAGRKVFDGAIPHISGSRKTYTNYEFAMPGRFSTQLEGHHYPGDQFPFTYATLTDPITGKSDGVLAKCTAQKACPKIMHWDSGLEFWSARSSLVATDPKAAQDVQIPDNVRLYLFSGTQHGPAGTPANGICQNLSNPLQYRETQRALMMDLQAWVANEVPPPPSRFPRLADGNLVSSTPQSSFGFPAIPGVTFTGAVNHLSVIDYAQFPPRHVAGQDYRVLVPKVDSDGNDVAGVRSAQLQAPLGTYTGWNLRAAGFMQNEGCYLTGSFMPFAATAAQRTASGDPRPSLEERYGTRQKYVDAFTNGTKALVSDRLLLQEDADRLIKAAQTVDLGPAVK
jgi:hypothetical protein